jgi:DNA polymerase III delta prime subunit
VPTEEKTGLVVVALEADLNHARRKRRRTSGEATIVVDEETNFCPCDGLDPAVDSLAEPVSWDQQLQAAASTGAGGASIPENPDTVLAFPSADSLQPDELPEENAAVRQLDPTPLNYAESDRNISKPRASTPPQRPKRMLQLRSNGTFGSPAQETHPPAAAAAPKGQRRISKRSLVVALKYGDLPNKMVIGDKINQILSGSVAGSTFKLSKTEQVKPQMTNPSKPTHPFFLGKAARKPERIEAGQTDRETGDCNAENRSPRARRASAATPGKIRAEAQAQRKTIRQPDFGSPFGHTRHTGLPKHVGLKEAAWPSADNVHVRGSIEIGLPLPAEGTEYDNCENGQKGKQNAIDVPGGEDILFHFQQRLNGEDPPSPLRKPERLITTGPDIQAAIRQELRPKRTGSAERKWPANDLDLTDASHTVVRHIYDNIETSLTPFDHGRCETQAWTQKYAPRSADDILQAGKEPAILRDWLRKSAVTAVHTGSNRSTTSSHGPGKTSTVKPEKKKKRRRNNELDDFIVDSDEEGADLEDFIELDGAHPAELNKKYGSSLVRGGIEVLQQPIGSRRLANAVLLSGPHGCGKTATVYAVAQELGFEVFEINAGTRRSGKDILDRIGDMAENHLVQRVSKILASDSKDGHGALRSDVKLSEDKPDSKQKGLSSFFKLSGVVEPSAQGKAQLKEAKAAAKTQPLPRNEQKQSVILLEEVDALFEEDKQFWMTVITLATASRRPIILTCNDENLVPIDALTLHAILHFTPPRIDTAVDYLLVIAAHEGHILQRDAVESLYRSCDHDLRAAIVQLNFWCQMGVGDDKGGLEWIYQRWPPGQDVDYEGRTLRVASRGTYQTGMGWFGRDLIMSSGTVADPGFEMLKEVRQEWPVIHDDLQYSEWLAPGQSCPRSLQEIACSTDFLSAADVCCSLDLEDTFAVRENRTPTKCDLFANECLLAPD